MTKADSKHILLTGASGFLGSAVLARIAARADYARIYLLIRGGSRKTAEDRAFDLISRIFDKDRARDVWQKIVPVAGDLGEDNLGLNIKVRNELIGNVNHIVHIGASTDFGAPLEESRRLNVYATENILTLARQCAAQNKDFRLDYVSTAFVAGTKRGIVSESDFSRNQTFANNYEQTKFEAEGLVRSYMKDLRISIIRPSIVVGDSRTGYTPHFKVLYWPLRLLRTNLIPFIPCNSWAKLDVVPIDFVANAMVAIMDDPKAIGQTFHLSAGRGHEVRIGRFLRDACSIMNIPKRMKLPFWAFRFIKQTPLRRLVPEDSWLAMNLAATYADYLRGTGVIFDATQTDHYLKQRGVEKPKWDSYKHMIFHYCVASAWGKRMPKPEYIYYLRAATSTRS